MPVYKIAGVILEPAAESGPWGCIIAFIIIIMIPIVCINEAGKKLGLWTDLLGTETTNSRVTDNSRQNQTVGTMRQVNTINLNMRSGPGANYSVIATFPQGSRIVSYGETKTVDGQLWTQASTPDGQTRGWVNRKFLSP